MTKEDMKNPMMITRETLEQKLGFNLLTFDYASIGDGDKNPLLKLTDDELAFFDAFIRNNWGKQA